MDDDSAPRARKRATAEADQEGLRRQELRAKLEKQFLHADGKFYYRDNNAKLAMEERSNAILTLAKDPRAAMSIVNLAEAKGWTQIKVKGSPDFRRNVWLEASARGLAVKGYQPTKEDELLMQHKRENHQTNEKAVERRDDPTREAVEAERKRKQQHEDYNLNRPRDGQTDKVRVIEEVVSRIASQTVETPQTLNRVIEEASRRLNARLSRGEEIPSLQKYDPAAPAKVREPVVVPSIDRRSERTR